MANGNYGGTAYAPRGRYGEPDGRITVAEAVLAGQGMGASPVSSVRAHLARATTLRAAGCGLRAPGARLCVST